jgi:surface protein
VELHCQRVLPYGIRQLIKDFLGALDNASIRTAVELWYENQDSAIQLYSHISLWDTHHVTDMSRLFDTQRLFNDDISQWDVSKVTAMSEMFADAVSFNQPIGSWNTSKVTDMYCVL